MGSTPDSSITIPSSGNARNAQRWAVHVFRNVSTSNPLDATTVFASGTASGRPDPGAITPSMAGAWILWMGSAAAATGAAFTAPTDFATNWRGDNTVDTYDCMDGFGYYTGWTAYQYDPAAISAGGPPTPPKTSSPIAATRVAAQPRPSVRDRDPLPDSARRRLPLATTPARDQATVSESTAVTPLGLTSARETAAVRAAEPAPTRDIVSPPAGAVLAPAEPRPFIEAAVQRYARALETGELTEVRQAYPGITAAQQAGLTAFFSAGGTMRTQWTIRDIVVGGDQATARIVGTNRVAIPKTSPRSQPVDLHVRLARVVTGWRIVAIN